MAKNKKLSAEVGNKTLKDYFKKVDVSSAHQTSASSRGRAASIRSSDEAATKHRKVAVEQVASSSAVKLSNGDVSSDVEMLYSEQDEDTTLSAANIDRKGKQRFIEPTQSQENVTVLKADEKGKGRAVQDVEQPNARSRYNLPSDILRSVFENRDPAAIRRKEKFMAVINVLKERLAETIQHRDELAYQAAKNKRRNEARLLPGSFHLTRKAALAVQKQKEIKPEIVDVWVSTFKQMLDRHIYCGEVLRGSETALTKVKKLSEAHSEFHGLEDISPDSRVWRIVSANGLEDLLCTMAEDPTNFDPTPFVESKMLKVSSVDSIRQFDLWADYYLRLLRFLDGVECHLRTMAKHPVDSPKCIFQALQLGATVEEIKTSFSPCAEQLGIKDAFISFLTAIEPLVKDKFPKRADRSGTKIYAGFSERWSGKGRDDEDMGLTNTYHAHFLNANEGFLDKIIYCVPKARVEHDSSTARRANHLVDEMERVFIGSLGVLGSNSAPGGRWRPFQPPSDALKVKDNLLPPLPASSGLFGTRPIPELTDKLAIYLDDQQKTLRRVFPPGSNYFPAAAETLRSANRDFAGVARELKGVVPHLRLMRDATLEMHIGRLTGGLWSTAAGPTLREQRHIECMIQPNLPCSGELSDDHIANMLGPSLDVLNTSTARMPAAVPDLCVLWTGRVFELQDIAYVVTWGEFPAHAIVKGKFRTCWDVLSQAEQQAFMDGSTPLHVARQLYEPDAKAGTVFNGLFKGEKKYLDLIGTFVIFRTGPQATPRLALINFHPGLNKHDPAYAPLGSLILFYVSILDHLALRIIHRKILHDSIPFRTLDQDGRVRFYNSVIDEVRGTAVLVFEQLDIVKSLYSQIRRVNGYLRTRSTTYGPPPTTPSITSYFMPLEPKPSSSSRPLPTPASSTAVKSRRRRRYGPALYTIASSYEWRSFQYYISCLNARELHIGHLPDDPWFTKPTLMEFESLEHIGWYNDITPGTYFYATAKQGGNSKEAGARQADNKKRFAVEKQERLTVGLDGLSPKMVSERRDNAKLVEAMIIDLRIPRLHFATSSTLSVPVMDLYRLAKCQEDDEEPECDGYLLGNGQKSEHYCKMDPTVAKRLTLGDFPTLEVMLYLHDFFPIFASLRTALPDLRSHDYYMSDFAATEEDQIVPIPIRDIVLRNEYEIKRLPLGVMFSDSAGIDCDVFVPRSHSDPTNPDANYLQVTLAVDVVIKTYNSCLPDFEADSATQKYSSPWGRFGIKLVNWLQTLIDGETPQPLRILTCSEGYHSHHFESDMKKRKGTRQFWKPHSCTKTPPNSKDVGEGGLRDCGLESCSEVCHTLADLPVEYARRAWYGVRVRGKASVENWEGKKLVREETKTVGAQQKRAGAIKG